MMFGVIGVEAAHQIVKRGLVDSKGCLHDAASALA